MENPNFAITFFERLEKHLLSGKKTATIRDMSESHYNVGQVLNAYTLEQGRYICQLRIVSIEQVELSELNQVHAKAENLPLFLLKILIRRIYPGQKKFCFIEFEVFH